jgi:hypothetical protein
VPMPPPKPSTDIRQDRQAAHEIAQIVRALQDKGPMELSELHAVVGATYWDRRRFDRALALARAEGQLVSLADGRVDAV